MIKSGLVVGAVIVVGAVVVYAYRAHNGAGAPDPDAPVVAPIRLTESDGAAVIKLDSAALANSRFSLAALRPGAQGNQIELPATVVSDPDAVTVIRAPVAGKLVQATGTEWPAYGSRVESGSELATVSDAKPISAPRGGTVTHIWARPGAVVQAGDPLLELTDFDHPLVSIVLPADGQSSPPHRIGVAPAAGTGSREATLLGPSPEADPLTHRPAWLYRLDQAWPAARPGLLLTARVAAAGAGVRGVIVPTSAVVQWDGLEWAWRRRSDGTFERLRVPTDHPVAAGWLAGAPWQVGDSIVTVGGEQLLSEEFRARVSVGDEVAE